MTGEFRPTDAMEKHPIEFVYAKSADLPSAMQEEVRYFQVLRVPDYDELLDRSKEKLLASVTIEILILISSDAHWYSTRPIGK